MKAALGAIPDKYIYSAYLGEQPLASIYHGKEKIWPDNSQRVTRMTLDVATLEGTVNGAYWTLALDAVATGCKAQQFVRITADRVYNINNTYGTYAMAYYNGNGEIAFVGGQGPLARNVRPGTHIPVRLVIPSRDSIKIGGTNNTTVSKDYPPCIPGSTVRGYFGKGRKKVSSGVRVKVEQLPSGQILLDRHQQQNGHRRGDYNWQYGTMDYIPGSTGLRLTVSPHQPVGPPWGGYFNYPAFNVTFSLKILRIQTTT